MRKILVTYFCFLLLIAKSHLSASMVVIQDNSLMPTLNNEKYDPDVIFHAYWNGRLKKKHLISIKSCYFFNIQQKNNRKIVLWVENNKPGPYDYEIGKYAEIRSFNLDDELKHTFLEGINFYYNKALSYYSDVVRYALLYKYGGCWFDLDIFFLRDFTPLFSRFQDEVCVYRWERENYPNGAIFISLQSSNEKLRKTIEFIIHRNSGWGFQEANLTFDLPLELTVLPCEWFDPAWVDHTVMATFNSFFEYQKESYSLDNFYPGAFCYHWHNRWGKTIEHHSPIHQLSDQLNQFFLKP